MIEWRAGRGFSPGWAWKMSSCGWDWAAEVRRELEKALRPVGGRPRSAALNATAGYR